MKQNSKLMLTMSEQVRGFWISLALLLVIAGVGVGSAAGQTTQTPQAYVQYAYFQQDCCPPGSAACDAFCPYWETYTVVTAFGVTNGSYDTQPTWSADGTKIAFTRNNDVFVADANGTNAVNITKTVNNEDPAWSPDGARIAFMTTRDGHSELYLMNPDGSNVVRLTYNIGFSVGHPAWSRDSARIAFNCQVVSGNDDICAINPDGSGFARLTTDPASDSGPTWSPDGVSIAFSTTRYGPNSVIAVMNADGSGVSQVGAGVQGWDPAWSPDGAEIAFDGAGSSPYGGMYTMKADGTNVALLGDSAFDPAWMPAHVPVATFKVSCNGLTCTFDASGSKDSYGTITSYAWNLGDGTTGAGTSLVHTYASVGSYTITLTVTDNSGATGTKIQPVILGPIASFTFACSGLACNFDASGSKDFSTTITHYAWSFGDGASGAGVTTGHTYAAGGAYNVTLTVTDSIGASSSQSKSIIVNIPPVASFTFSCTLLTCSFDGSASRDSDGTITNYAWNFGDGTTGSGVTVTHTYRAPGTYGVTLTVTDNGGATGSQSNNVTVVRRP